MLVFFQHQHPGTVTKHKTITIFVPGTTCSLWIVVARGQCPCGRKASQAHRRCRHLCATGDHYISIAILNRPSGKSNAVSTCCTGGGDSDIRTAHPVHNGEIARNHINNGAWYKERRHSARPFVFDNESALFYRTYTADT